ncbi:MAG: bifunctional oligoribonuclease/PAP phosphatase NrnA [Fusobacteria bacterium]|nr:bifunctional oligoribonuclease/PAP phosphatase NrnA [Fusobacteriota bacterium]
MKELIKYLKKIKGKDVLVISHESPDGDAIGSIIGFSYLLKDLGARPIPVNNDGVPDKYAFLEEGFKIKKIADFSLQEKKKEYYVFILDSAKLDRIGFDPGTEFPELIEMINIDHHISNNFFAEHNFVYPEKGATSEIIGDLYLDIMKFIPKEAATAIYTGVMTDTGNLTYESTTSGTVALVSILIAMEADINKVRQEVYEKNTFGRIAGLKAVLNNLQLKAEGLIAYTYLPYEIIDQYELKSGDIENYVDYPRSVDKSEIAILFKEFSKDEIRVSVRTKSYIDANKLADVFKGGGHKRASGFRVRRSLNEAMEYVLARVEEGLKKDEWIN